MGVLISRCRRLTSLQRLGWLLYQPYKWLVYFPFAAVSTFVFGSSAVVLSCFLPPRWVSWLCGAVWARLNGIMTPMLVTVEGRENVDKEQSYVIVCNHQSFYDVFLLYGWLGIDFKWIIKREMRSIPFLGAACARVGHVFIDRSDRNAALASINEAKPRFVHGTSVLFFPEGTRSRTGTIGRFKKGAFRVALDLDLPILPMTIIGTRIIVPPDGVDLLPGRARLVIHPPIQTRDVDASDLTPLMDEVRSVVAAPLDRE